MNRHAVIIRLQYVIALVALVCALDLASWPAEAAEWIGSEAEIKDGFVTETGPPGTRVFIFWTGISQGKRITLGSTEPVTIGPEGKVAFKVPRTSPGFDDDIV